MAQKFDDPFSNAAINAAMQTVETTPDDQIQGGLTYTPQTGLQAEIEGDKQIGKGWYVSGDLTYSQRAALGAKLLIGWKPK